MSDDLRQRFDLAARDTDAPDPDYRDVLLGGRRRLWTKRAAASAGVVLLVGVGSLITSLPWTDSPSGGSVRPSMQTAAEVPNSRIASFAVRAVARAGLLDLTGDFNDYKAVAPMADTWLVTFDSFLCSSVSCDPSPEADTRLIVELRDRSLVIVEATGDFGGAALQQLLSYEEEPTPEDTGLSFPYLRISGSPDEGVSILGSPLWTGPIPAGNVQVECRLTVLDGDGSVLFERRLDEPAPLDEEMRAGTRFIFGVPSELSQSASRADVDCQTMTKS